MVKKYSVLTHIEACNLAGATEDGCFFSVLKRALLLDFKEEGSISSEQFTIALSLLDVQQND